ncbi:hypothetical protein [Serratia plymuthica]|uniref:hypothetical protein n=1 Tax=Serratia plymuthica TaxID=82996 RepID=UPI0009371BD2|nr:hypothetical protein [Serratia plymuthica]OJT47313.1 hypothetical protein BSR04_01260 [Serratia plymuthica]
MKEYPVIFNSEMVRAFLDGRKTQTRRVMKDQPEVIPPKDECGVPGYWIPFNAGKTMVRNKMMTIACPFGQVGDRLWVREAFGTQVRRDGLGGTGEFRVYRASNPDAVKYTTACGKSVPVKWTPSIHMPRRASRILLEITAVRVERLNDISEEDARAEGATPSQHIITPPEALYRVGFSKLWRSIYGEESWDANPFVWVIEFKRVRGSDADKNNQA